MILKLLKHELKSSYRNFAIIYGIVLSLGVLAPMFYNLKLERLSIISVVLILISAIPFFVVNIVVIVQRFSKNLFGNEGYLTLTLPVKVRTVVLSKILSAVIWIIAGVVVYFLSLVVLWIVSGMSMDIGMTDIISPFFDVLTSMTGMQSAQIVQSAILYGVVGFISTVYTIVLIYFALTLTNIGFIHKFKKILGVALFFLTSIITSTITNWFLKLKVISIAVTSNRMEWSDLPSQVTSFPSEIVISLNEYIVMIAMTVVLFISIVYLIKNHLSMQ